MKRRKKYLSPDERPSMDDVSSYLPAMHKNAATPSAKELMDPPVKIGEGSISDNTSLLTIADLPNDWLSTIAEVAKKGGGMAAIINSLNLTKAGFLTLMKTSAAFAEAVDRALLYSEEWWDNAARSLVTGEIKGSSAVYIAYMANKHGWNTTKQESTQQVNTKIVANINTELSTEELETELNKRGLDISGLIKTF